MIQRAIGHVKNFQTQESLHKISTSIQNRANPQAMSIQNISIVSLINSCMENSLSGLPQHYYYSHYSLY